MTEYFVHPQGICETTRVGPRSRLWAFSHALPGAQIGADCNICDHVFIENDVIVGNRVTVKSGVQLWDGMRVGDDVFIGPNATFTNDRFPRSRRWLEEFARTRIGDGASIGANATILPGLTIGAHAMVGAGAVVTANVPANAIVYGNPARIHGYVDALERPSAGISTSVGGTQELVGGARLIRLSGADDMRGRLAVSEFGAGLPFVPQRVFIVYQVPSAEVRGEHAHKECHQFLVCVSGSVNVLVDDGADRAQVTLNSPELGLYVPPMIWGSQFGYSPDAALTVLASHPYDPGDYVRDYDEFIRLKWAELT